MMPALVQILQVLSGALWLLPAVLLLPRIVAVWRKSASRTQMLSAPIGFLSWLMVGYSVRWLAWPTAISDMTVPELLTWAALYCLSGMVALWFFIGAIQTRGE